MLIAPRRANPAIATDIVVLAHECGTLGVLLFRRPEEPFAGRWELPGGFLEPHETVEAGARRALLACVGVTAELDLVKVFSAPDRDPREYTISVAHLAFVDHSSTTIDKGISPEAVDWAAIADLPDLAFDHASIIEAALSHARASARRSPVAARMLPPTFTLAELQTAQEALLGAPVDKRNFRHEVVAAGWIEPAGDGRRGRGRPATMWRISPAQSGG